MAAHQYWRVLFARTSDGTTGEVRVSELVFSSDSVADLCVGGTAIASSEFSLAFPIAQAFDKSTGTNGWASVTGQFPAWLGYVLPTPADVLVASLTCATNGLDRQLPMRDQTFLQWSDDGSAWTSVEPGTRMVGNPSAGTTLILVPGDSVTGARGLTNPLGILRAAPPEALTPTGPGTRAMTEPLGRHDPWFGGNGFVAGTTKNTPDTPVGRRVVLLDYRTSVAIRETWSDSVTGAYRFENLNRDTRYTVISYDHTGSFKGVIADNLTAEVMP